MVITRGLDASDRPPPSHHQSRRHTNGSGDGGAVVRVATNHSIRKEWALFTVVVLAAVVLLLMSGRHTSLPGANRFIRSTPPALKDVAPASVAEAVNVPKAETSELSASEIVVNSADVTEPATTTTPALDRLLAVVNSKPPASPPPSSHHQVITGSRDKPQTGKNRTRLINRSAREEREAINQQKANKKNRSGGRSGGRPVVIVSDKMRDASKPKRHHNRHHTKLTDSDPATTTAAATSGISSVPSVTPQGVKFSATRWEQHHQVKAARLARIWNKVNANSTAAKTPLSTLPAINPAPPQAETGVGSGRSEARLALGPVFMRRKSAWWDAESCVWDLSNVGLKRGRLMLFGLNKKQVRAARSALTMYTHSFDFTREDDSFEQRVRVRPNPLPLDFSLWHNPLNSRDQTAQLDSASQTRCSHVHSREELGFVVAPFRIGNLFHLFNANVLSLWMNIYLSGSLHKRKALFVFDSKGAPPLPLFDIVHRMFAWPKLTPADQQLLNKPENSGVLTKPVALVPPLQLALPKELLPRNVETPYIGAVTELPSGAKSRVFDIEGKHLRNLHCFKQLRWGRGPMPFVHDMIDPTKPAPPLPPVSDDVDQSGTGGGGGDRKRELDELFPASPPVRKEVLQPSHSAPDDPFGVLVPGTDSRTLPPAGTKNAPHPSEVGSSPFLTPTTSPAVQVDPNAPAPALEDGAVTPPDPTSRAARYDEYAGLVIVFQQYVLNDLYGLPVRPATTIAAKAVESLAFPPTGEGWIRARSGAIADGGVAASASVNRRTIRVLLITREVESDGPRSLWNTDLLHTAFETRYTNVIVEQCCKWSTGSHQPTHPVPDGRGGESRDVAVNLLSPGSLIAFIHTFDILIGAHGAGLTNAIFIPPGGVVGQLKGNYGEDRLFANVARTMHHSHVLTSLDSMLWQSTTERDEETGEFLMLGYRLTQKFCDSFADQIMTSWTEKYPGTTDRI